MTGAHRVSFIHNGKVIKEQMIEAIEMQINERLRSEMYNFVTLAKPGDKIIIETELEE